MPIYFRIAMNVSDTIFPMIEIKEKVAVIWHSMRLLIFTCSTIYTIVVLMSFCSVILFCNKTFAEQFFFSFRSFVFFSLQYNLLFWSFFIFNAVVDSCDAQTVHSMVCTLLQTPTHTNTQTHTQTRPRTKQWMLSRMSLSKLGNQREETFEKFFNAVLYT